MHHLVPGPTGVGAVLVAIDGSERSPHLLTFAATVVLVSPRRHRVETENRRALDLLLRTGGAATTYIPPSGSYTPQNRSHSSTEGDRHGSQTEAGRGDGWINSPPLRPDELQGHVLLVNFWTLTCINWLRTMPHIRAWSRAYRDDGLIVVGVHTPEFSFEHQIELVDQAVRAREIDYPVALDNDYAIWNAFDNHYWPAVYLLDEEGTRRGQHFGEGSYEQVERAIQRLLGVERPLVTTHGTGVEAEADWPHLHSPETYLGRARTTNFTPATAPPTASRSPSTTGL